MAMLGDWSFKIGRNSLIIPAIVVEKTVKNIALPAPKLKEFSSPELFLYYFLFLSNKCVLTLYRKLNKRSLNINSVLS